MGQSRDIKRIAFWSENKVDTPYKLFAWKALVQGIVRKWGNSAAVRLPASVLEAVSLKIDQTVDVREEDGRIIIEPVRSTPLKLEELVSGITQENRHDEMDFGRSSGGEVW